MPDRSSPDSLPQGPSTATAVESGAPAPLRVELPVPFPIGTANAWLLGGRPLTLVDAGVRWDPGMVALERALAAEDLRVEDVEQLILTHHHADHAGLAADVRNRSGCLVVAHAATAAWLSDVPASRAREDAFQAALLRVNGAPEDVVASIAEVSAASARWQTSVEVDLVLGDGDLVTAGGHVLRAHLAPGHSSTDTILAGGDAWAIVGDHVLAAGSSAVLLSAPRAGVARVQGLPEYQRQLRATAERGYRRLLPGHGATIEGPARLIARRLARQEERVEEVRGALGATPVSAWGIARALWPERELWSDRHPISVSFLVLCDVLGLLALLEERGQAVTRVDGRVVRYASAP